MDYILRTHSLTKKYKEQYAVNEVNMNIAKGDIYGFIGENGAGKTTIIRLITGLADVTSGNYELFGCKNNTKDIFTARRRISAVVESPSLYLNLTAYENLLLQCKVLGVTDLAYIDETLKTVGLEYLKNDKKRVRNFSLGMKQRLGIAVALIGHPDFIILDEPMNGLDPEGIVEIRELILRLNQEKNITFMISSHILTELSRVATKYGFIHRGKIIKEISAKELQEECRKCLELEVNDVEKVPFILESVIKTQNYKILNKNQVRIFDEVDITLVVNSFSKEGIIIKKVNNKDESIEEYYLNIMGGKNHD